MRFFQDMKKYFRYARYAAKSALNVEVAGSYLNWLWWIFNPFCMMIIYTLIFGYIFNKSEPFFPIFVFLGLTLWDYFNRTLNASVRIVKRNKHIVTKVYLPKFVLVETEMFVDFVKLLISFGLIIIMLIFFKVPVTWRIVWLVPLMAIESLFTFGLSTIVLHFGVFVEDLSNIVKILLRFVFYATGIFYSIPKRIHNPFWKELLLHYNPMAMFINTARNVVLYETDPEYLWMLIWTGISLLLCLIGVKLIYRYENSYAKVI